MEESTGLLSTGQSTNEVPIIKDMHSVTQKNCALCMGPTMNWHPGQGLIWPFAMCGVG